MILAKTMLLLAALVTPANQIAVNVEVWPNAVKMGESAFNSETLNRALVRELSRRGFAVGTSTDLPRLTVQVAVITVDNPLGVEQHATIAAVVNFTRPLQPGLRVDTQAASCSKSTISGFNNKESERARTALNRCVDQLATEISADFVRRRRMVIVR